MCDPFALATVSGVPHATTVPPPPLSGLKEVIAGGVPLVRVTNPFTERSAAVVLARSKI